MSGLRPIGASAVRIAASISAVATLTYIGFQLIPVNAITVGFLYVISILVIARHWGLVESITASFVASICFNYFFLPPILKFTIADPQNWVALAAFLATAIFVSKLSTTARSQTESAIHSQLEMERLYALSRAILLIESDQSLANQAARQIARAFNFSGVSLYERSSGEIHRAGPEDLVEWDDRLREVAIQGTFLQDPKTDTLVTAIRLGADPIGSLALRGVPLNDSALQSLANLVAIALERARALDAANRADVARQSDQLKSTLLDAIAHEFKTPLTSIKAAATALLATPSAIGPAQRELITIVDEEADRLGHLVTEAIQMARIEAGRVALNRKPESIATVVSSALSALKSTLADRSVVIDIPASVPLVIFDPELIELALRQLLDNANKYSPANTAITIEARIEGSRLVVGVRNQGPGIPESEQARIFTRFYRDPKSSRTVPGTGMGLAIARDILLAHQGQVWVESSPGLGTEFFISIPLAQQEDHT